MRLGLIGAVGTQVARLRTVAGFLLDQCEADRVVYLGIDDAMDHMVSDWVKELIRGDASQDAAANTAQDASEEALWARAAECLSAATTSPINEFVEQARRVRQLQALECLPGAATRSVELLDGHLAILIHDKADLDQEDILPARFLIFGKGSSPLIKQVGQRWFLCPGSLDKAGVMLLDDGAAGTNLKLYDSDCKLKHSERLTSATAAKVTVSGQ